MAKKQNAASEARKTVDLRSQFLALTPMDQQVVTNFFNMHNAAHFLYDLLSGSAKDYVNYCVELAQEADKIEKKKENKIV